MLSPVWIPMGSKFSMLQTIMQASSWSLRTSYSTSFHFPRYSSTRIWWILLWAKPMGAILLRSPSSRATPVP